MYLVQYYDTSVNHHHLLSSCLMPATSDKQLGIFQYLYSLPVEPLMLCCMFRYTQGYLLVHKLPYNNSIILMPFTFLMKCVNNVLSTKWCS